METHLVLSAVAQGLDAFRGPCPTQVPALVSSEDRGSRIEDLVPFPDRSCPFPFCPLKQHLPMLRDHAEISLPWKLSARPECTAPAPPAPSTPGRAASVRPSPGAATRTCPPPASQRSRRLFPGSSFLDLGDLNESDFLNNAHFPEHLDHFAENMEDFSNDLFSSFFDDPVLDEKSPLLDMELDSPTPGIQAEHSYSLSGDSAPQSPLVPIKMEDTTQDVEHGAWALGHKLCSVMVKQEQSPELPVDPLAAASSPMAAAAAMTTTPLLGLSPLSRLPMPHQAPGEMTQLPMIKAEPQDVNQFLKVTSEDLVQMPPTPPSSHGGSDSDGSQSPRSLPPSSPVRPMARSSTAISTSPLLTAPHGTSGPLLLTEEEKRTLIAEGYPIPTKLPLTKAEEKALKRVRRKIKNKISAQESRRKKKEYVECLEKKVETFTSENNELWKKVETLENANRTLLQQLQKLQTLVTNKISRPYKMAATQTGTCLMVGAVPSTAEPQDGGAPLGDFLGSGLSSAGRIVDIVGDVTRVNPPSAWQVAALCFVLVLGSLVPCLPEFSSSSQTVKEDPTATDGVYAASQMPSRSLLFYDEGASSWEDGRSALLPMEPPDGWEIKPGGPVEQQPQDHLQHDHLDSTHETSKYLSKVWPDDASENGTSPDFSHPKEWFHDRDLGPNTTIKLS
ncbi:Cyclic AMP-responsive element-binding protein 3-like protein 1 [Tupaia chinensis]|uniref:Cyclic AMP-responsive element-binding protein 3-like protein 1 n=1 Tax=Tupaia chinensis TaxID=246437 RepID=L9JEQ2_TUPCH|nr:Cyclic AMP-responsive element-binding protein 3-like protein 1 [Tupaia chinensis]